MRSRDGTPTRRFFGLFFITFLSAAIIGIMREKNEKSRGTIGESAPNPMRDEKGRFLSGHPPTPGCGVPKGRISLRDQLRAVLSLPAKGGRTHAQHLVEQLVALAVKGKNIRAMRLIFDVVEGGRQELVIRNVGFGPRATWPVGYDSGGEMISAANSADDESGSGDLGENGNLPP